MGPRERAYKPCSSACSARLTAVDHRRDLIVLDVTGEQWVKNRSRSTIVGREKSSGLASLINTYFRKVQSRLGISRDSARSPIDLGVGEEESETHLSDGLVSEDEHPALPRLSWALFTSSAVIERRGQT